ncbi:MAG: tetratricopeptide repeat protein [Bacteroidales bacterium]|nr:tetratricopeptide repeat protein [Bacteroidales bacterium]
MIFIFQFSILHCFSQDRRPDKPPQLPFQQNAPQAGNDEQLAIQFYQNREYDKAAEIYERLFQQKAGSYYYQYLLFCWIEVKEYDKAERLIKKMQKAEPNALKYTVDMGYLKYREGNPDKSKKTYEEALKRLIPNQQQIIELANAFIIRGEFEYAIKTYQRGRELMNNTYPFGVEMAGIYERMGDFSNVMEEYLDLLEANKSYMNAVEDKLQMLLANDINNEKNERLRKILLSRAQQNPDKTQYPELLWWYSVQQKDFELALVQAKALDRRLKENGDRLVQLANLAVSNEDYKVALECYQYLISKGASFPFFDLSRRESINTRYLVALSTPAPSHKLLVDLEKEMKEEIQKANGDPQNISLIRNLAHLDAFYLGNSPESTELLEHAIEIPGITPMQRAECKLELADILLFTDDVWEATLLYQQVYKEFRNDVIGQEAKFKNTKLSFYIGEFKWALAQADILKAATSKFIANDAIALSLLISENLDPDSNTVALGLYSRADLLDYRNEETLALKTLDSIPLLFSDHPILQQVMYKKAEILRKQGNYVGSDSLYEQLARKYPEGILADEALMQSAALNEKKLDNKEKAMNLYQELMEKYPGSIFVPDARKRFRILRGDNIR